MSSGLDLVATFISADNEKQLQKKLFELQLETKKMNNIVNIYTRGSKIHAWLFVEMKYLSLATAPSKEEVKVIAEDKVNQKKKRTKKKASKKVN